MACSSASIPVQVCQLKEAVEQLQSNIGHPPAHLTNLDAPFSWDDNTQIGNVPLIVLPPGALPEVVRVSDAAARAALAPTQLPQLLIQVTDAANGNLSIYAATGLTPGAWALRVASMASQNSNAVSITGGTITGITDLAKVDGGTGASTSAGARVNLSIPTQTPAAGLIDWVLGDNWAHSINSNQTYTFAGAADGLSIMFALSYTAGSLTVTWPAGLKWPGGTTPTPSGSGKTDVISVVRINGALYGSVVSNFTT